MGTLCMPTPPEGRRAYLDHQLNSAANGRLVKSAQVGAVYYAAFEITDPKRAPEPFTIAIVCRSELHDRGREFCYKDMDESMGLSGDLAKCPAGILNLLTPVEQLRCWDVFNEESSQRAAQWREACRAFINRPRLKAGDRIRTAKKLHFQSGLEADTFVKSSIPHRRNLFRVEGTDKLVRLGSADIRLATIL